MYFNSTFCWMICTLVFGRRSEYSFCIRKSLAFSAAFARRRANSGATSRAAAEAAAFGSVFRKRNLLSRRTRCFKYASSTSSSQTARIRSAGSVIWCAKSPSNAFASFRLLSLTLISTLCSCRLLISPPIFPRSSLNPLSSFSIEPNTKSHPSICACSEERFSLSAT